MTKVTIGLMVYNEVRYIRQSLQTIQSQSFNDYEILVGDNASNDGSSEIIAEFAASDPRIIHIKRSTNIGALQNWNDIVRRANGEYFVLAGGHDLWSTNYLANITTELDDNPDAVLAFAKTQWIDENGNELNKKSSILDTSGMSKIGRFLALMFANQHYLYGMIRTTAMKKTRLQLEIVGSGEIFLQELAVLGDFVLVENERWCRRQNRGQENVMKRMQRYKDILFSTAWNRQRFKCMPMTQMMLCYLSLPFLLKGLSIFQRIAFISAFPIILVRFARLLAFDILWLFRR